MDDFTMIEPMDHSSCTNPFPCFVPDSMTMMPIEDMSFGSQEPSISKHKEATTSLNALHVPYNASLRIEIQNQYILDNAPTMASFGSDTAISLPHRTLSRHQETSDPYLGIFSSDHESDSLSQTVEPAQICPPSSPQSSLDDSWSTAATTQWENRELVDDFTPLPHSASPTIKYDSEEPVEKYKSEYRYDYFVGKPLFPCDRLREDGTQCPKSFKRQEHLKRHLNGVHNSDEPHVCIVCLTYPNEKGKSSFNRNDNLTQHVIKTHLTETPKKRNRRISDEEARRLGLGDILEKRDRQKVAEAKRKRERESDTVVKKESPGLSIARKDRKAAARKKR